MNTMRAAAVAMLCIPFYATAQALAATLTVCVDGCQFDTIGEAVAASVDGDIVALHGAAIHVASGLLIDRSITIRGAPGIEREVRAAPEGGTASDRIFSVTAGNSVLLEGFRLTYGHAPPSQNGGALHIAAGATARLVGMVVAFSEADSGGGIYNAGTLELTASAVIANIAEVSGGGIHNVGTALITGSTVAYNDAQGPEGRGGGVFNPGGGILLAHRTAFLGNTAIMSGGNLSNLGDATLRASTVDGGSASYGGGIQHGSGRTLCRLTLEDTDFGLISVSGNQAIAGGAMSVQSGSVLIRNSRIAHGFASGRGGGIHLSGGSVRIESSTIHGSTAGSGAGIEACSALGVEVVNSTISGNVAMGDGGGLHVCQTGVVRLANVTIAGNVADADGAGGGEGGGIFVVPSGDVVLQNSIVDDNEDRSPAVNFGDRGPDCFGVLDSAGHNLVGSLGFSLAGPGGRGCELVGDQTGNQVPADAALLGLADWGGTTPTHALSMDSPARDAGDPAGCVDFELAALERDQRGYLRDQACDIGAFEYAGTPPDPLFSSGFEAQVALAGTEQASHRLDAIGRDAHRCGVLANQGLVRREVHAVDLVVGDEAVQPLDVRAIARVFTVTGAVALVMSHPVSPW